MGFCVTYVVADQTLLGQRLDDRLFLLLFSLLPAGWLRDALGWFARELAPGALAALVTLLIVAAVGRHAWSAVVVGLTTPVGSVVATAWLRDDLLVRAALVPEPFPDNSLPSIHASAAAALVAVALVLWPRVWPWWLPNAAAVVLLTVALGNVLSQAHRPSDVAASFLLVGVLMAAALALFPCAVSRSR